MLKYIARRAYLIKQDIFFFFLLTVSKGGTCFGYINSSYQTFVRMSNSAYHEFMFTCSFQDHFILSVSFLGHFHAVLE